MTLDELKTSLEKYRVLQFLVLDEYATLPSNSLYKDLQPLVKECYDSDEMIAIVASVSVTESVVKHLIDLVDRLDIPTFFVHVFTDSTLALDLLIQAQFQCHRTTVDVPVIQHGHEPVFDTDRSMCAHPWAGLHIFTDGTVGACCETGKILDETGTPYNVQSTKLVDIFNSETMRNLRKDFIAGKKNDLCKSCWSLEGRGLSSQRAMAPYRLSNIYPDIIWEGTNSIRYIGGHFSSLCNLGCRICSPKFSTTLASEELKMTVNHKDSPAYQILKDTTWMPKSNFLDQITELAPDLQTLEALGGEPFLFKQLIDTVQHMSDQGISNNMRFIFITNGSVYPEFLDAGFKFRNLEISFSVDNIGERFEYERYHHTWDLLTTNIEKFIKFKTDHNNVKLGVCVTINIQNVLYLDEIDQWISSLGLDHRYYGLLQTPSCLSITKMTDAARELVISTLSDKFDHIKTLVQTSSGTDGKDFVTYMKKLDVVRSQNFADTHPAIAKAMGY